ncbi:hypothetical protein Nepgr_027534 [Nepenthes gracilis]|uniref:Galactinol--sucrose galactosyltransferase n=1 Tax=Nepenthes gracilis TaxID=150966 RepID=A0AAD3TAP0_NEPGR|nr:hypothetical protein Nepgr_027534 [Nepenthes gracilis]
MAPSLTKANSFMPDISDHGCSPPLISLEGSDFLVNAHVILSDVPSNITATPSSFTADAARDEKRANPAGCFVGFDAERPESRHVVPIGKLTDRRFMSIFRFKVWWTTHWVGTSGGDLEHETQIMMLDKLGPQSPYVLLLPLLEGPFRASLQPGQHDYVDICVESGSTKVIDQNYRAVLYMHAGNDPFRLVKDAMKVIRAHLGTFRLLEEKSPPGVVDKFGWCTWDAFYLTVHPHGVWEGVKGLVDGGCPPGLVLIDDGWQSICHDDDPITDQEGMNRTSAGEQMPCRLIKFEENYKFRDYVSPRGPPVRPNKGMGAFVRDMKNEFKSVEHVYVWHAFCGYWGGIRPNLPDMPVAQWIKPKLSPGLEMTMEDLAVDKIVNNGVGLVPPELALQMYEGLHSHLESVGIDGVKVDVIHLLEMLCEDYGGRVDLAKAYYKAMTTSVRKHFKGSGVIASMEHCNDFMFLELRRFLSVELGMIFGALIRPVIRTVHFGYKDAICDSVGKHNFDLLKTLVLPDGSILRCEYYALPTRDCLFEDPLHDGKTMLKIWNLNKFTGVLGAFNCQGGGWNRETRRNQCFSEYSKVVTSTVSPREVEWENGNKPFPIEGIQLFAMYFYKAKKLVLMKPSDDHEISLEPFNFELITVSRVLTLSEKPFQFAPFGLVNMLNSGGAIQSLDLDDEQKTVRIGLRGEGKMMAFASEKPRACRIDGKDVKFEYVEHMVAVPVPWPGLSTSSMVEYLF